MKLLKPVAFLATTNPAEALEFYGRVLRLPLLSEDGFVLIFDLAGTPLHIQVVDGYAPHDFAVLGWQVADIGLAVSDLTDRGVEFELYPGMDQDDLGIWDDPDGPSMAWFKDPDGNLLALVEEGAD